MNGSAMQLTSEHRQIADTVERFIVNEVNPHVAAWEAAGEFPSHQVFKQLGDLGLLGLKYPEAFGGAGLDFSYSAVMAEALGVCACGGGFWSDNNVCLNDGNCRTDADCGEGGACSPTLGDCGDYAGVVAYYCHTPTDECVDDADCTGTAGRGYCAYNPAAGHWMCSDAQCVG